MDIVAVEATQLPVVHIALHEVITLHPVLMRRQVGILIEIRHTRLQVFEPPDIRQTLPWQISHRPVIDLAVRRGR